MMMAAALLAVPTLAQAQDAGDMAGIARARPGATLFVSEYAAVADQVPPVPLPEFDSGPPAVPPRTAADRVLDGPIGSPSGLFASVIAAPVPGDGRDLGCMTMAIAYEAGNQPVAGQQAVGQVILNRTHDPRYPKSVCGVVFDGAQRISGCQFTFTCDGSLRRRLADSTWLAARQVAASVLGGAAPDRVAGATHYHADYVNPYWASIGFRVARIGAHIFYRIPGGSIRSGLATVTATAEERAAPALRHLAAGQRGAAVQAHRAALAQRQRFAPWGLPIADSLER